MQAPNEKPFVRAGRPQIFNTPLQMSIPYRNVLFVFMIFVKTIMTLLLPYRSAPLEVDSSSLYRYNRTLRGGFVVAVDGLDILYILLVVVFVIRL